MNATRGDVEINVVHSCLGAEVLREILRFNGRLVAVYLWARHIHTFVGPNCGS